MTIQTIILTRTVKVHKERGYDGPLVFFVLNEKFFLMKKVNTHFSTREHLFNNKENICFQEHGNRYSTVSNSEYFPN